MKCFDVNENRDRQTKITEVDFQIYNKLIYIYLYLLSHLCIIFLFKGNCISKHCPLVKLSNVELYLEKWPLKSPLSCSFSFLLCQNCVKFSYSNY